LWHGTQIDFENFCKYPDFELTELVTQELADEEELELEDIQAKIYGSNIAEEAQMELRAAIEGIQNSHNSRSVSAMKVLKKDV
jgi:hypothetical protein